MRTAALMAVLMLAGCSAQAVETPGSAATPAASRPASDKVMANLEGTEWRFVEVAGASVPAAVVATLRVRGNHISGRAGCNSYGGSYRVADDGSVSFSQILSTKMACLEPAGAMQVEHRIFELLPRVSRLESRDRELVLLDPEGQPLARLEPSDRSRSGRDAGGNRRPG